MCRSTWTAADIRARCIPAASITASWASRCGEWPCVRPESVPEEMGTTARSRRHLLAAQLVSRRMETAAGREKRAQSKLERAGDLAARATSLQPSDPNLRRGLHAAIAIVVVLGVGLAVVAGAGDFPDVDWRFRPLALLLSIAAFTLYLFGSAEIWRRILGALGHDLPRTRSNAIWFSSGLGRYVPTAVLLPVLRMAMAEREGVPKRITLASVAYELPLFLTGSVLISAYFVITLPDLE